MMIMDKIGYKVYLQSLGNQQHYIGMIPVLLELEREYNINLDDYIPYNNNYRKVDALNEILPDEVLYNEKLALSINSYICYRLSGFDIAKVAECKKDSNPIYDKYFTFNGSASDLKVKLLTFMTEADSLSFINSFNDFAQCLEEDEFMEVTSTFPDYKSDNDFAVLYSLVGSSNYNINIKAITLITIALLLDIKLTLGFASTALAILGFNNQAIVRVDVSEGEKCLILEAMYSKNRIINEDVFSVCNSECVHNDLRCKYQNVDTCTIKKDDIRKILNNLCDKNIFKKINNLYKYNF